jgi:hypothetical protein
VEHDETKPVTNPETGAQVYPAMTGYGQPILASGAVEGCDCEECLNKEDEAAAQYDQQVRDLLD